MSRNRAIPQPGHWVTVQLPNGQRAKVTTRYTDGRRLVVIRPIGDRNAQP